MAQQYHGYFALVLDPAAEQALKAKFATLSKVFSHHMTVRFGTNDPTDLPMRFGADDVGKTFRLRVIGFGRSAQVEAVAVGLLVDDEVVTDGITANKVPHITVTTDGVAKPFASNALLERGYDEVADGLELECTLQHVM